MFNEKLPDFEAEELCPRLAFCRFMQDDSGITPEEREKITREGTALLNPLLDDLCAALAKFDQQHLKAYWIWRSGTTNRLLLADWAHQCDIANQLDLPKFAAEVSTALQEVFNRHRTNW